MCLHTKSIQSGSGCMLHVVDQFYDTLTLGVVCLSSAYTVSIPQSDGSILPTLVSIIAADSAIHAPIFPTPIFLLKYIFVHLNRSKIKADKNMEKL